MMSERRHLLLVAPPPSDDEHRVVRSDPDTSTVLSLAKERDRQKDKDQYRRILHGLALVFTVALMAAGIWPAVNAHGFSLHPRLSGPP
jgi:hypothetical protein